MMSQQQLSTVRDGRVQLAIMSAFVEVEVYAFWRLVFGISRYPSFVEVRARVFFELLSDEGRRWNFASCLLFFWLLFRLESTNNNTYLYIACKGSARYAQAGRGVWGESPHKRAMPHEARSAASQVTKSQVTIFYLCTSMY